jgi:hypothetical protein
MFSHTHQSRALDITHTRVVDGAVSLEADGGARGHRRRARGSGSVDEVELVAAELGVGNARDLVCQTSGSDSIRGS